METKSEMPPTKKAGERNEPADDQRNDGKVECTCSRRCRYVFNLLSDFVFAQNQTIAKQEYKLLIKSTIKDRTGRHEFLLPINHSHYNIRKIHLEQITSVETMS